MRKLQTYLDYLVEFIQTTTKKAGAKGVVVGISGGIDSAVVANLAKKAFPDSYLTVWMPISSSQEDRDCAAELVKSCQLNSVDVDLGETYKQFQQAVLATHVKPSDLAMANSKARLRMTTLYALAQSLGYLVLGTDNWDEWHVGYFTKFGDGGVDAVPIIHLLKREVREAAELLGVPQSIIKRAPTAGLWAGQTDESELGMTYEQLDDYLLGKTLAQELTEHVTRLHEVSEHKRHGAVQPDKRPERG